MNLQQMHGKLQPGMALAMLRHCLMSALHCHNDLQVFLIMGGILGFLLKGSMQSLGAIRYATLYCVGLVLAHHSQALLLSDAALRSTPNSTAAQHSSIDTHCQGFWSSNQRSARRASSAVLLASTCMAA